MRTHIKRRDLIKGAAAFSMVIRPGRALAQMGDSTDVSAGLGPNSPLRPIFKAAVMRIPVLVPPSVDALESIRQRNAAAMLEAIERAMIGADRPRLLVFPVLPYTSTRRTLAGIPMSAVAVDLISEPFDQGVYGPIVAACRRYNCYVATSTQEKNPKLPGTYHHTGLLIGPEGLVLRSPKAQAYSAPDVTSLRDIVNEYTEIFGDDSIFPVVDTPIGKIGCLVEGEVEVMEAARFVASKGAEIIVHPSLESDDVPWSAIKQATAYQCHVFLLTGTVSRNIGVDGSGALWRGGASTIIGPDGAILASMGGQVEGIAIADIDLNTIEEARLKTRGATRPAGVLYKDMYRD